jgi:hypothetical protein
MCSSNHKKLEFESAMNSVVSEETVPFDFTWLFSWYVFAVKKIYRKVVRNISVHNRVRAYTYTDRRRDIYNILWIYSVLEPSDLNHVFHVCNVPNVRAYIKMDSFYPVSAGKEKMF